ncbi:hypothetical protein QO010_003358 [Caulobacter ginsengisoli]|uniref:Uncharacterized protein n=1 Tax=Caulobacter ginsengisoli TaxID=400775 RepID=A0ABU0IWZ5_9CAUL|nr:twin-arginine translocation signal domain-containing protein [Caulobacter ginsengisoli]MDQ0465569.1 hypothetical protein [Caulobacter ginsengisoli]
MAAQLSRRGFLTAAAALAVAPAAAHAQVTPISQIDFPMSDARSIGPNSVRFGAAQGTERQPNIALFGVTKERWPEIRTGIQQSIANGFPPRVVFMGPTDAPPSLEIYAKGILVTRPIDPNTMPAPRLTALIKNVYAEMYPTTLASASPTPSR